jgi:hypothetical protein
VASSFTCRLIVSHAPKAYVAVALIAVCIVRPEVRRRVGIVLDQPVDMVGLVLIETHECLVAGGKPTLLSYGVVVSPRVLLRFFLQVTVGPYPHQTGTAEGTHASCVGPFVFKDPDAYVVLGFFGHLSLPGSCCCSCSRSAPFSRQEITPGCADQT